MGCGSAGLKMLFRQAILTCKVGRTDLYTLCLKKVPTFKLSVTLSNLNRFSKFFALLKSL